MARLEAKREITLVGGSYNDRTYLVQDGQDVINVSLRHSYNCDLMALEIYERSVGNPNLFRFTKRLQTKDECTNCLRLKKEAELRELDRQAKEDFKNSITVKVELGDYGYDWSMAQIGESPDARLWIRYGSGCSCSSIDEEEWTPFTESIQAKQASRHLGDNPHQRANFIAEAQGLLFNWNKTTRVIENDD